MATKSKKFSKEDELLLQDFSRGVSTKVILNARTDNYIHLYFFKIGRMMLNYCFDTIIND